MGNKEYQLNITLSDILESSTIKVNKNLKYILSYKAFIFADESPLYLHISLRLDDHNDEVVY